MPHDPGNPGKLGQIRKIPKCHRTIAKGSVLPKVKMFSILAKNSWKTFSVEPNMKTNAASNILPMTIGIATPISANNSLHMELTLISPLYRQQR